MEDLLFEITNDGSKKINAKKVAWYLDYLENTELNQDQQSLFKLLSVSAEAETSTPKKLNLKEVCDIMEKVNKL